MCFHMFLCKILGYIDEAQPVRGPVVREDGKSPEKKTMTQLRVLRRCYLVSLSSTHFEVRHTPSTGVNFQQL